MPDSTRLCFVYLVSQQPAFALMIMDALSKSLRASNAVTFRMQPIHERPRDQARLRCLLDNEICTLIEAGRR